MFVIVYYICFTSIKFKYSYILLQCSNVLSVAMYDSTDYNNTATSNDHFTPCFRLLSKLPTLPPPTISLPPTSLTPEKASLSIHTVTSALTFGGRLQLTSGKFPKFTDGTLILLFYTS